MRFPGMRCWFASAVLVLAMGSTARVQADDQGFQMRSYVPGKQLLDICSGDRDSCYMYVYGILDLMMLNDDAKKTCSFNPEGVAGDKAVAAVLAYLKTHQDRLDWSAAALVQNAIRGKYPCAKKKTTSQNPSSPKSPDPTQTDKPSDEAPSP